MKYCLLGLVVLLGCATTDTPSAVSSEKPVLERDPNVGPGQEHAEQALEVCVEKCENENAMRSVAAEVIRSDCEASCGKTDPLLGSPSLQ